MDFVVESGAVLAPDRVLRPGWVHVRNGTIKGAGRGRAPDVPGAGLLDLGDAVLAPGFVDVHCHGGGGHAFGADQDASLAAARTHLGRGTTTQVASLVSGPRDRLRRQVDALTDLVADDILAGVHLEGPWLSPAYAGAHDLHQLRPPSRDEVSDLLSGTAVRMVTIAPELDGALDAIRQITSAGAVAAIGHTDADDATTRAAVAAGATHATHLFNAMRPLRHRDPGPVPALLEDPRVSIELILDGVHLHPALHAWLQASLDPGRIVAVTDATAAAGCGDGRYRLGDLAVEVTGGTARISGTDTIAGSTATMDALFRAVAASQPGDAGLLAAARQAAANPSRALGLSEVGRIEAGGRADLVVLSSADLSVTGVVRRGVRVAGVFRAGLAHPHRGGEQPDDDREERDVDEHL